VAVQLWDDGKRQEGDLLMLLDIAVESINAIVLLTNVQSKGHGGSSIFLNLSSLLLWFGEFLLLFERVSNIALISESFLTFVFLD
jgi:hypothetical protein